MKKILFLLLGSGAAFAAIAQDDVIITATNSISKAQTPDKVIKALEKAFPDAKSVQYFKVTPEMIAKGWSITDENHLSDGETIDHYTISFTRSNVKFYGLFDAEGNLEQSRWEEKKAKLPDPVKTSLKNLSETDYKGYKLVSKTYYKTKDHKKGKEYYEVVIQKDNDKKKVFVSPEGTVLKVKG